MFISIAFLASVFFAPLGVMANETSATANVQYESMNIEQIQALIVKLQKIIQDKKNNNPCFVINTDLSVGDGEDGVSAGGVKRLQEFLREKGFFKYTSTGYFGKITRAAVIAYQKSAGLEQTGEFNTATRARIHASKCQMKIFAESVKNMIKEQIKPQQPKTVLPNAVSSITVMANGKNVSWTTVGNSQQGYKIVWSKNAEPTYPTRDGDKYIYLSEPNSSSTEIEAFNGTGNYYVRVCEYLDGKCGIYSNQITVGL